MKAIKKNFPAIISICMLIAICATWAVTYFTFTQHCSRQIISIILGVIAITGISFLKEKHIFKSALPLYLGVTALLVIQLIYNDFSYYSNFSIGRYLSLFDILTIYTAALLPLTAVFWSKLATGYKSINFTYLCGIGAVGLLPALLVFLQPNNIPVFLTVFVLYIATFAMSIEKRINIHPALFIIPVIAAAVALIVLYKSENFFYITDRINTILTRGQHDPLGAGWTRITIDSILTSTPFIGQTEASIFKSVNSAELLSNWGATGILIILAQFGWLPFIGIIACYGVFFACLFRMVKKTNQSSFAKYTSFTLALWLFAQAALNIISIFLLDHAYIEMPFIAINHTTNIVNFVIFAIIFTLYIRRDCNTETEEYEFIEEDHFSIRRAMTNLFSDDESYEDPGDITVSFFEAESISNKLIETAENLNNEVPDKYLLNLAESYYHAAQVFSNNPDNYDTAERYFMKALEIFEKLYEQDNHSDESALHLAYCCYSTGYFFMTAEEYYKAEKYLLESIRIRTRLFDSSFNANEPLSADMLLLIANLACSHHDLAVCHEMQKNYGNAEKYYILAFPFYGMASDVKPQIYARKQAKNLWDLADLYQKMNKYNEAAEYSSQAISVMEEYGVNYTSDNDYAFINSCYKQAISLYFDMNQYKNLFKICKKALEFRLNKYSK